MIGMTSTHFLWIVVVLLVGDRLTRTYVNEFTRSVRNVIGFTCSMLCLVLAADILIIGLGWWPLTEEQKRGFWRPDGDFICPPPVLSLDFEFRLTCAASAIGFVASVLFFTLRACLRSRCPKVQDPVVTQFE